MKHSSTWLTLILIASVLLLSAARNGAEPQLSSMPPKPSITATPIRSGIDSEQRVLNKQKPAAQETQSHNPATSEHLIGGKVRKYQPQNQRSENVKDAGRIATITRWFSNLNWIVVFTGLLAALTAIQARLLYKQTTGDRPYLVAESFSVEDFNIGSVHKPVKAIMSFKNYGNGPAFITDVRMALAIVERFPCRFPRRRYYRLCKVKEIERSVLGPNDSTEPMLAYLTRPDRVPPQSQPPRFSPKEWGAILDGALRVIFYGRVTYRDSFKRRHETGFFWVCDPPHPAPPKFETKATFVAGPSARNYYT